MGWSFPWVSSVPVGLGFNFDRGFSHTEDEGREVEHMMKGGLRRWSITTPARRSRRRWVITESRGFSAFVLESGAVLQTYATTWRGWSSW